MISLPTPVSIALPPLPKGYYSLSFQVLSDDRLGIVATDFDYWRALRFAEKQGDDEALLGLLDEAKATIWTFDGKTLMKCIQFPLLYPFLKIDQFPNGDWLVAETRTLKVENTRIFKSDSREIGRIMLGDGIEHIKIDELNRIWVGWFDEGVFGNDNWDFVGQEWPPSSTGIAAFDIQGRLLKTTTLMIVDDCYALNVFGDEVWSCTYSDFPVWNMNAIRERVWRTKLSGTEAIAVDYPFILAAGGYEADFNRLILLKLDDNETQQIGAWHMPQMPNNRREVELLDGRGNTIHMLCHGIWYRWRVEQFL